MTLQELRARKDYIKHIKKVGKNFLKEVALREEITTHFEIHNITYTYTFDLSDMGLKCPGCFKEDRIKKIKSVEL